MNELPLSDADESHALLLQKVMGLIQIQVDTHLNIMETIGNLSEHQQLVMMVSCPLLYGSDMQATGYDVYVDSESNAAAFFGIVDGTSDCVLSVYPADESQTFQPFVYITRSPSTIIVQTVESERQLFTNKDEIILGYDTADLEVLLDIINRANTTIESNIAERLRNLPRD